MGLRGDAGFAVVPVLTPLAQGCPLQIQASVSFSIESQNKKNLYRAVLSFPNLPAISRARPADEPVTAIVSRSVRAVVQPSLQMKSTECCFGSLSRQSSHSGELA